MRTVAVLASTLATAAMAQSPEALVKMYTHQSKNSDNPLEAKFAEALEARVVAYAQKGLAIPSHITDTVLASLAGGSTDRASDFCPQPDGCQATISLEQIWAYGCWCMLATPTAGSGEPVDGYDAACRAMSHCNRCAEGDDADCDAKDHGFQVAVDWDQENFGLNMDCSSVNQGDRCAEHLCACEINFLKEVLDLLWEGEPRDESFQRTQNFDYTLCMPPPIDFTTEVPTTTADPTSDPTDTTTYAPMTTSEPEYKCCGLYPSRVILSARKECCQHGSHENGVRGISEVFNPITQECCAADGVVRDVGTCP